MRRAAICLAMFCLFGLAGSIGVAAEKAATADKPAALEALGITEHQIVSEQEAQSVRGEAYSRFWVGGGVFVHNAVAYGVVYMESYEPTSVSIILSPLHFGFWVNR